MENWEAVLGWDDEAHLLKIVLPASVRREGISRLNAMNITRTSLFPGLDGLARSLGVYHISFNPVKWQ